MLLYLVDPISQFGHPCIVKAELEGIRSCVGHTPHARGRGRRVRHRPQSCAASRQRLSTRCTRAVWSERCHRDRTDPTERSRSASRGTQTASALARRPLAARPIRGSAAGSAATALRLIRLATRPVWELWLQAYEQRAFGASLLSQPASFARRIIVAYARPCRRVTRHRCPPGRQQRETLDDDHVPHPQSRQSSVQALRLRPSSATRGAGAYLIRQQAV